MTSKTKIKPIIQLPTSLWRSFVLKDVSNDDELILIFEITWHKSTIGDGQTVRIAENIFFHQNFGHGLSVAEEVLCHVISNIKMSSSSLDTSFNTKLLENVGSWMTGFILVFDVIIFNPEAKKSYARIYRVPQGNRGTGERVQTRGTSRFVVHNNCANSSEDTIRSGSLAQHFFLLGEQHFSKLLMYQVP